MRLSLANDKGLLRFVHGEAQVQIDDTIARQVLYKIVRHVAFSDQAKVDAVVEA